EDEQQEIGETEPVFDIPTGYDIEREFAEQEIQKEFESEQEAPGYQVSQRTAEEDISLYNDELMPYSFRWWLYKTRLEHADTYQPFSSPVIPKHQKGQFDPKKLDDAILDQQIRENIFHLQNPEDKLSDQHKK